MAKNSISPLSSTFANRSDGLPEIFALVIGINKYASSQYEDLAAAVRDADRFEEFLVKDMVVSPSNILNLRDEQASRAAIISAFIDLRDDIRIAKDEAAIIIYYAGHGARVEKPLEWVDWETPGPEIEMMCPADLGTVKVNKTGDEEMVDGIPDRTISVLLNHLSDVKGDNITFILDCCSSAGINRSMDSVRAGYVPRQIFNPPAIHRNCDRKILSRESRSAGIAQGFSGKHSASHVLLAACGRDQAAYEDPRTGSGLFTDHLLKILTSCNVDDLTYTALMHRLPMPLWQTPHCEGQNVHRRLFNKKASGADGSFILSKRGSSKSPGHAMRLQAGAAQGITIDSTYSVHTSNLISDYKHSNPPLGSLLVTSVNTFSSELSIPPNAAFFKPPRLFYCKLMKRGSQKIALHCEDRNWLEMVFPRERRDSLSVSLVDNSSDADLRMLVVDGKVHLERNDPMLTPYIASRLPHVVDQANVDLIREVVRCAIHFNHHLIRTSEDFRNVWMELKKLRMDYSNDFDQILTPIEGNLIEEEPATVVVDELARLGMTVFNQTDLPLYPYLFYFDPSDFVILEWYTPPFGAGAGSLTTSVDAPLPPKSKLTIGYGDGGFSPWQFLLRDGEDKDIGFFKLFLTTSPADFSSIVQGSPFESSVPRYGKPAAPKLPDAERWGAKLATVIQVRKSN